MASAELEVENGRIGGREAAPSLQDELRLIDSQLEQISGRATGGNAEPGTGAAGILGDSAVAGRDDFQPGRANDSASESDSGTDRSSEASHGILRSTEASDPASEPQAELGVDSYARVKSAWLRMKAGGLRWSKAELARQAGVKPHTVQRYLPRIEKEAESGGNPLDLDKPAGIVIQPSRREQRERQKLEAPESEPTKEPKQILKKLFQKKEETVARPLTDQEATSLKEKFKAALRDYFSYADEFLYATVKGHPRVEIWGDMDDEELAILADAWVAGAKRSAIIASSIRGAVQAHRNLKLGLILLPRFYKTFKLYADAGGFSVR